MVRLLGRCSSTSRSQVTGRNYAVKLYNAASSNTLRGVELRALDELRPHELQWNKLVLSAL